MDPSAQPWRKEKIFPRAGLRQTLLKILILDSCNWITNNVIHMLSEKKHIDAAGFRDLTERSLVVMVIKF